MNRRNFIAGITGFLAAIPFLRGFVHSYGSREGKCYVHPEARANWYPLVLEEGDVLYDGKDYFYVCGGVHGDNGIIIPITGEMERHYEVPESRQLIDLNRVSAVEFEYMTHIKARDDMGYGVTWKQIYGDPHAEKPQGIIYDSTR